MRSPVLRAAVSAPLIALAIAGCGGGSTASSSSSGSSADVTVHAKDTLKFDKSEYTAKAGSVTIAYVDDGSLVHTLLVEGKDGFKLQVSGGTTKTGSVDLTAGTYTIYCDIAGHRAAGMVAKLTIS